MSCQATWRAASTLLIASLVALTCAMPAQALKSPGRYAFEGPAWTLSDDGFWGLLLRLLEKAGGGMDPNGNH
jgi:hypothetical protein